MKLKSALQIAAAASVEIAVTRRTKDVNVDHWIISWAKAMGRDGCAGAEHLPCTNLDLISFFGQLHIKSDDKGRKLLCSRPELVGQPSLSHFNFA